MFFKNLNKSLRNIRSIISTLLLPRLDCFWIFSIFKNVWSKTGELLKYFTTFSHWNLNLQFRILGPGSKTLQKINPKSSLSLNILPASAATNCIIFPRENWSTENFISKKQFLSELKLSQTQVTKKLFRIIIIHFISRLKLNNKRNIVIYDKIFRIYFFIHHMNQLDKWDILLSSAHYLKYWPTFHRWFANFSYVGFLFAFCTLKVRIKINYLESLLHKISICFYNASKPMHSTNQ